MDIDKLLQVHHSVNLATIREQNKYMLGVQAEQCGQIMQLRKQIDASNYIKLQSAWLRIRRQIYIKFVKQLLLEDFDLMMLQKNWKPWELLT